ncbi:hypothetical protein EHS25_000190 [Saitozyma podzolica]|uniref:Uncharacterized protein n=1 Tax=Saitozyma podzolica TaxID=1890683 RepID=A0A427YVD4_9TREE|nr:hypothetical protein EHS25_000190 [Saitozyma podzolica]
MTEELVASYRKSCPGLITYSEDTLVTFRVPRWKITFHPGRGGIIHHSYDTGFRLADDFDVESPPPLDPEPVWEGGCCRADLILVSSAFLLGSLEVDIRTIRRILEARTKADGQPITELSSDSTLPFGRDEFMSFAKGPGIHVQRLRLHDSQWTHQPLLSILDLSWLVDVVKDHMPNLAVLDLMLTGFPDGNDPPLDQSIPLSTRAYDGKLRRISILLHEVFPFGENPDQVPVFAIARNLACLGAPGCEYELEETVQGPDKTGQVFSTVSDLPMAMVTKA